MIFRVYFLLVETLFYALSMQLRDLLFKLFYLFVLLLKSLFMLLCFHLVFHNVHLQILLIWFYCQSVRRIDLTLANCFIIIVNAIFVSLLSEVSTSVQVLWLRDLNLRNVTFWTQTVQLITMINSFKTALFS